MRTGTNMTIQDYFNRSGIKSPISFSLHGNAAAVKTKGSSFSQALVAAQSSADSQSEPRGMSIRDYVARPVHAIRSFCPHPGGPKDDHSTSPAVDPQPINDASLNKNDSVSMAEETSHPVTELSEKDKILNCIEEAAKRYNLPTSLVRAVVKAESDYQVRAVSPAGAQGLMQLMPATARELGVQNPFDISQNIDGGAKYLRKMLDQFDGDIKTALSAYNAGPGTVSKFNGNVPYTETRNYVERVMRFSRQFS